MLFTAPASPFASLALFKLTGRDFLVVLYSIVLYIKVLDLLLNLSYVKQEIIVWFFKLGLLCFCVV